jgi:hypothetical protein
MPSFHVECSVGLDRIAAALNVMPLTDSSERLFWSRYLASEGIIPPAEYRHIAAQLLSKRLREYVDNWLNTGIGDDGYERPFRRTARGRAFTALTFYTNEYPPRCYFDPELGWTVTIDSLLGHPTGLGQLHPATEVEAQRLFFALVAGDLVGCLCKCRYSLCGRYFVLRNPREKYKSGTYCRLEHQRHAKATRCMKEKRECTKARLLELAAGKLHQLKAGSEWQDDSALKHKARDHIRLIARKDGTLRDYAYLAVHWITRNRQQIEQRRIELTRR